MKNKYCNRSKISETKFRLILKYFAEDFAVADIATLTDVSRPAVTRIVEKIRKRMLLWLENEKPFSGEVEVDESYFRPRRIRGKRGRGAGKKVLVLGILKRGGNVYTQIISNADKEDILPILQGKVLDETTVHTVWLAKL
jgi:GTPase Era involved in 16S rRNA processing